MQTPYLSHFFEEVHILFTSSRNKHTKRRQQSHYLRDSTISKIEINEEYENLLTGNTTGELSSRWILPHDDNSWLVF